MRTPEDRQTPDPPKYADRAYRSAPGVVGGVLLLALTVWLGGDAMFRGHGRTPWLAAAGLLLAIPLIVAFTVRPAVYAGSERIRIRNPFRTITLAWESVDRIRASYSTELFAGDAKYQVWAIPVSIRARKRATRQEARMEARQARGRASGRDPFEPPARRWPGARDDAQPARAWADQALAELRELSDQHPAPEEGPRPKPRIRWSYEIIAPAAAGAVMLTVLLATG